MTECCRRLAIFIVMISGLQSIAAEARTNAFRHSSLELCWLQMGGPDLRGDSIATGNISFPDDTTATVTIKTMGGRVRIEEHRGGQEVVVVGGVGSSFVIVDGEQTKFKNSASAHFRPEFLPMLQCGQDSNGDLHVETLEIKGGIQHLRIARL